MVVGKTNNHMKRIKTTLLFLALLLGVCSSNSTATESVATQNPAPTDAATNTPVATEFIATETAVPEREAIIFEIENSVSARASSNEELMRASVGMSIGTGGGDGLPAAKV